MERFVSSPRSRASLSHRVESLARTAEVTAPEPPVACNDARRAVDAESLAACLERKRRIEQPWRGGLACNSLRERERGQCFGAGELGFDAICERDGLLCFP